VAFLHEISLPRALYSSLVSHRVPHAPPISLFFISSTECCTLRCASHESPCLCDQGLPCFNAILVTAEGNWTVTVDVLKVRNWKEWVEPIWCWYQFICCERLVVLVHFPPLCLCFSDGRSIDMTLKTSIFKPYSSWIKVDQSFLLNPIYWLLVFPSVCVCIYSVIHKLIWYSNHGRRDEGGHVERMTENRNAYRILMRKP
jgi:hypothetical protein